MIRIRTAVLYIVGGLLALTLAACGGEAKEVVLVFPTQPPALATATPDPSVGAYSDNVRAVINGYAQSLALLASIQNSIPTTLTTTQAAAIFEGIRKAANDLIAEGQRTRSLKAPACFSAGHALLVSGSESIDKGASSLIAAVSIYPARDTIKESEATAFLSTGQSVLNQAVDRINRSSCT